MKLHALLCLLLAAEPSAPPDGEYRCDELSTPRPPREVLRTTWVLVVDAGVTSLTAVSTKSASRTVSGGGTEGFSAWWNSVQWAAPTEERSHLPATCVQTTIEVLPDDAKADSPNRAAYVRDQSDVSPRVEWRSPTRGTWRLSKTAHLPGWRCERPQSIHAGPGLAGAPILFAATPMVRAAVFPMGTEGGVLVGNFLPDAGR